MKHKFTPLTFFILAAISLSFAACSGNSTKTESEDIDCVANPADPSCQEAPPPEENPSEEL